MGRGRGETPEEGIGGFRGAALLDTPPIPGKERVGADTSSSGQPPASSSYYASRPTGSLIPEENLRLRNQLLGETPFTPAEAERMATVIVDHVCKCKPGDHLLMVFTDSQQDMAEQVVSQAIDRGVRVYPIFDSAARIDSDSSAAVGDFQLLRQAVANKAKFLRFDIDAQSSDRRGGVQLPDGRLAAAGAVANALAQQSGLDLPWSRVVLPSREMAEMTYPEASSPEQAFQSLGQDMLAFSFIREGQTVADAEQHIATLRERQRFLNQVGGGVASVEMTTAEGTHLAVDMLDRSRFMTIDVPFDDGEDVWCNWPTFELFGTPVKASARGEIACTRPTKISDEFFEGIRWRFADDGGIDIASLTCDGGPEKTLRLREIIVQDNGRRFIGELAFVGADSPLTQSERSSYYNGILDENAVGHIGMGKSWENFTVDRKTRDELGLRVPEPAGYFHSDFMWGSKQTTIVATMRDGQQVEIMREGIWQDEKMASLLSEEA